MSIDGPWSSDRKDQSCIEWGWRGLQPDGMVQYRFIVLRFELASPLGRKEERGQLVDEALNARQPAMADIRETRGHRAGGNGRQNPHDRRAAAWVWRGRQGSCSVAGHSLGFCRWCGALGTNDSKAGRRAESSTCQALYFFMPSKGVWPDGLSKTHCTEDFRASNHHDKHSGACNVHAVQTMSRQKLCWAFRVCTD